ncbi:MAG: nitrous oxide-stimulated promoter family protein [bacterium]|nr:nitrous oxide-stimulated promoter family protein [bacterium]
MNKRQSRIQPEQATLEKMIEIYCVGQHRMRHDLCAECEELRAYALQRLNCCPFGEKKGTCAKCPVHCYKTEMRQKIRQVMRYAGPRMLYKHPIFALRHLFDGFKRFPKST